MVTPADARALLLRRRPGTGRNAAAVAGYGQAMREGRWIFNGMPLVLSRSGRLLDGQQRLLACIEAERPFRSLIAENIADDALHSIDQQRRRSFASVLDARGVPNAKALLSALIKLIRYDDGTLQRTAGGAPGWARLDRVLRANPALEGAVASSLATAPRGLAEPVRTPLLFMGRQVDPDATARLLDAVYRPEAYPLSEPGALLRYEIDRGGGDPAQRPRTIRLFALAIQALDATMAGRPLRRLAWQEGMGQGLAEPFPRLAGYSGLVEPGPPAMAPPSASLPDDHRAADDDEGFRCDVEVIDRALAEKYLDRNEGNRPVMRAHVEAIARDIVNGRWMLNAQPICFARGGRLLNGQHRLRAVILADGAIEVPVMRGLDEAAFATYDLQARRGVELGDQLDGGGDRALVVAMLNLLWRREVRTPGMRHSRATAAELRALAARHPRLAELRGFGRKMVDFGRASVMGYGAYVIEREDPALAAAFLRALESGAGLALGHRVLQLRVALQRLRRDKAAADQQLALLLEGWSRYRLRPDGGR